MPAGDGSTNDVDIQSLPIGQVLGITLGGLLVVTLGIGTVGGHGGGLGAAGRSTVRLPTWLVLVTGGAAVGASFLLSSFVTDRALVDAIDDWHVTLPNSGRVLSLLAAIIGLAGLVGVVMVGLAGPQSSSNAAVLLVWVGWWAGFTMSTNLLGNAWPALNPVRTLVRPISTGPVDYPERLGRWPAVVGLLLLVWLEVVSPLATAPRLLVGVITAYVALTVVGAIAFGAETWFGRADPVAGVFECYGRLAPIGRSRSGKLELRLPGAGLTRWDGSQQPGFVGFVVALVWATTYDGLVATPAWATVADALVGVGVPPVVLYPVGLFLGFLGFGGLLWLASRMSRVLGPTYLSRAALLELVAPSLVAIAAGYHVAHYLGYFLTYLPTLLQALSSPLAAPVTRITLGLPPWFEGVGLVAVLLGHLLAIWVAHSRAFDAIPGRMAAIRAQAPVVAVMVLYTMVSLWIVAQPAVPVPYT